MSQRDPNRMELKILKHVGLRAMKLACQVKGLSWRARLVLCAIGAFANGKGFSRPGEYTLTKATGLGERTVRVGLRELEGLHIIKTDREGFRGANHYQINIKVLDAMAKVWGPAGPANVDEVDL